MSETKDNNVYDVNNEDKSDVKKNGTFARVFALVLLGIYVVLLGGFIYTIISGSEFLWAMLFVIIIYPIIIYLLLWLKKVFTR